MQTSKQTKYNTKSRRELKQMLWARISLWIFAVTFAYLIGLITPSQFNMVYATETKTVYKTTTTTVQEFLPPTRELVINEIIDQARASKISVSEALQIAECESNYNAFAKSTISTSKGTFQFIDKTWKNYCTGNVYDYKANISCFMELYPKHPEWWECRAN